jgi:hypothetical protein
LSGLARFVVSAGDTFPEKRFRAILPWERARNRLAESDIRLNILFVATFRVLSDL